MVLLGNGDGSFLATASYTVGQSPYAVKTGDFNGDGNEDIAVSDYAGGTVSVLLGTGSGVTPRESPPLETRAFGTRLPHVSPRGEQLLAAIRDRKPARRISFMASGSPRSASRAGQERGPP
jgi:hypothetical protein